MEKIGFGEKIGIVGDLHLGVRNGSATIAAFQQNYIMEMLDYYHSIQVGTIIQIGDYVDVRRSITGELVHWLSNTFIPKLAEYGMTWIQLQGNHSQCRLATNELTWDQLLEDLSVVYGNSCVKAITKPTDINVQGLELCCIPWINPDTHDLTVEHIEKSDATICLGHFELSNMYLLKGGLSKHETIDKKYLKCFEQVISGHYHTSSSSGNIFYTGTPYSLNWGEWEEPAENGIYTLTCLTQKLGFIPNKPDQTMFKVVQYNYEDIASKRLGKKFLDVDYLNDTLHLKDSVVRVEVLDRSNSSHYKQFLASMRLAKTVNFSTIDLTKEVETVEQDVTEQQWKSSTLEVLLEKAESTEGINNDKVVELLKASHKRCTDNNNLV